jgi:putative peptidoglycan lipid II flippase
MVGKLMRYLGKEVGGLHEAAYLLAFFTFLSQILALVRDRLFAHEFGAGVVLDVYYASFRVPDIIFASVASLVSISVLVPLMIDYAKKGREEECRLVDSIFSFFFLLIVGVSFVAFVCAPLLLRWIFPLLMTGENGTVLVTSMRIILLSPILLGLSNFYASIMQVRGRFVTYALAPILYNIGIIIGALVFFPIFGQVGLACGVVLGALFHMVLQIPYLLGQKLFPRFFLSFDRSIVRTVMSLSVYRTIGLSSTHIALISLMSFAGAFAVGSIAIFNFAWNLQSVPLAIVGVSYSMALFPLIARLYSAGDRSGFIRETAMAARHIIFWSLPVMVMFIVLRAQIIRTILGSGEFSWTDTRLTAAALALFTVSLLAQSLILLFTRSYYATGNTRTPLILNVSASILVIASAWFFQSLFSTSAFFKDFFESLLRVTDLSGTAVLALPLGFSIAMLVSLFAFWFLFERDFSGFTRPVSATFFQSFSASIIGGFVSYLSLNMSSHLFNLTTVAGVFFQGLTAGLTGIIVIIAVLLLLKNQEIVEIWKAFHRKIWKSKVIVSESESL